MKKVIVIAGVTGAGKSALSIELAHALNGEIISADSVAIYKHLDIGSAKLSKEAQDGVVHHLMDALPLDAPFDVATFQKEGRALIDAIHARGRVPIVVGGTGLYINALIQDYRFDAPSYEVDIEAIEALTDEALRSKLKEVDPQVLDTIHPNNRKRLVRALKRYEETKNSQETITAFNKDERVYDAKVYFLTGPRDVMYERMNQRVTKMFESGLIEEVEHCLQLYPNFFQLSATQAIGYREFEAYFNQTMDLDTVKQLIQRNTRRFAKRQWTWFKHQTQAQWIDISEIDRDLLIDSIRDWLTV